MEDGSAVDADCLRAFYLKYPFLWFKHGHLICLSVCSDIANDINTPDGILPI